MKRADVVVIGGGPGGYVAALSLAQRGVSTVLVEQEHLGGVCLNWGCIPTKALYVATGPLGKKEVWGRMGVDAELSVDLPRLRAWIAGVVGRLRSGVARLLSSAQVEVVAGRGCLLGPGRVGVNGEREEEVEAKAVILATGSSPLELPHLPFDGGRVWSSTDALRLPKIPGEMVVVGGGVVGLELATIYRRLGSLVTVVEMMEGLLPGVGLSSRAEAALHQALARQGISVRLGTAALAATAAGLRVRSQGKEEEIPAEVILSAVGRRPNSQDLGLEELGIALDRGFVRTDEGFRAGPGVFAIGDLRGGVMLAHKASHEGLLLAERLASELRGQPYHPPAPPLIPQAIFTQPEMALVGRSPEGAEAAGYKVARFPFGALGRAWAEGESEGFCTVVSDAEGRIVGWEILGPHASDLLGEAGLAVARGLTLEDLAGTVHAHPTFPEALWEAVLLALGRPLHSL